MTIIVLLALSLELLLLVLGGPSLLPQLPEIQPDSSLARTVARDEGRDSGFPGLP